MRKSKRVLVTGGAGFIGSHVVDRLVADGYSVRVIDDLSAGRLENISGHLKRGRVDFVEGDVRNASVIEKSVEDVDAVVHLAAVTSVPFSVRNPVFTFDVNVTGTLNLLRSCAEHKVSRLVYASSCAVYGEPRVLPVKEAHPTNPISPYAESKLVAERYVVGLCARGILDCVALRFFNVYGPRQCMNDYSGVITRFVDLARRGEPLTVYGSGSATRDFVFVEDVVDAVMLCCESREAVGEVFNVGTGKATTVNELAKTIIELTKSGSSVCFGEPRAGDIKHSYADVSKAEMLLGFSAKFGLREGLRVLIEKGSAD